MTVRMYLCARCRATVVVCRRCDRGQIYCDRSCAAQSRGAAQRAAGQRYQTSRPGRFAHAARARRYRARCKIVTHQGSVLVPPDDLLPLKAVVAPLEARAVMGETLAPDPAPRSSAVDPYVPFIVETLTRFPTLTASRLFVMVRERGYRGGASQFRHRAHYAEFPSMPSIGWPKASALTSSRVLSATVRDYSA